MATRAERREMRRIEDKVKAGAVLTLLVALIFAGFSGLSLGQVLFAMIAVGAVGVACFLVVRSRQPPLRRRAICAIIIGLSLCGAWKLVKAPPEWPQTNGTVVRVVSPPALVETEYVYQAGGSRYFVRKSKEWPSLDDAKRSDSSSITLYVDPRQPTRVSDQPTTGYTRVAATLNSSRVESHGT